MLCHYDVIVWWNDCMSTIVVDVLPLWCNSMVEWLYEHHCSGGCAIMIQHNVGINASTPLYWRLCHKLNGPCVTWLWFYMWNSQFHFSYHYLEHILEISPMWMPQDLSNVTISSGNGLAQSGTKPYLKPFWHEICNANLMCWIFALSGRSHFPSSCSPPANGMVIKQLDLQAWVNPLASGQFQQNFRLVIYKLN